MSFHVNPTYELTAVFPESPRGSAIVGRSPVALYGLTEKEVKAFSTYFIRRGADIGVKRTQPFSIRQEFTQTITDEELEDNAVINAEYRAEGLCGDCGQGLYEKGAPGICAAGHLCSTCDETHYDCKCDTAD
jgi:hypothetical protein